MEIVTERGTLDVLDDFAGRMSLHAAERRLGLRNGTLRGAIERGELRYVEAGTRYKVTPSALAEWVQKYQGKTMRPLPGEDRRAS